VPATTAPDPAGAGAWKGLSEKATSPAPPTARTRKLVTPAGTTNDCSAPVETNVSVSFDEAEAEPAANELAATNTHVKPIPSPARRRAAQGGRSAQVLSELA
jgi:hypothetical protein